VPRLVLFLLRLGSSGFVSCSNPASCQPRHTRTVCVPPPQGVEAKLVTDPVRMSNLARCPSRCPCACNRDRVRLCWWCNVVSYIPGITPMLSAETVLRPCACRLAVQLGTAHIPLPPCFEQAPRAIALVVRPRCPHTSLLPPPCLPQSPRACTLEVQLGTVHIPLSPCSAPLALRCDRVLLRWWCSLDARTQTVHCPHT
jgi:hypothetical protein